MIKLNLQNISPELVSGINELSQKLKFENSPNGIKLNVHNEKGNIIINFKNNTADICYDKKVHFFRALGLLIQSIREGKSEFSITEEPKFNLNGIMLNLTGTVLNVPTLKDIFRHMAIMGLDNVLMYMENTYPLDDEPFFNYMNSKYTAEELKEADAYADMLGVELIPTIQTLGHMGRFLRWQQSQKYADTAGVILADDEETFKFIDKMIKTASSLFKSNKIHIGLDETYGLGTGAYKKKNGTKNPLDIFQSHLIKVAKLCESYNLKPIIWGDMYFYATASTGQWYEPDMPIPQHIIDTIPQNVEYIYWDYYHNDKEYYKKYFDRYTDIGIEPSFSSGAFVWNSTTLNFTKTKVTADAGLEAAKEKGIKNVYNTIWSEANGPYVSLPALQYYAEHGYCDKVDIKAFAKRLEFCTGITYDDLKNIDSFDNVKGTEYKANFSANPSSCLLWQDILTGLYDYHAAEYDYSTHYKKLYASFCEQKHSSVLDDCLFNYQINLAHVLSIKADIGLRIKYAYDNKDKDNLKAIASNDLPELYNALCNLKAAHFKQWNLTTKPIEWLGLDRAYSYIIGRTQTAIDRINAYVFGEEEILWELEQERQPYFVKSDDPYHPDWSEGLISYPTRPAPMH